MLFLYIYYYIGQRLFIPCSNVYDIVKALKIVYMKPVSLQLKKISGSDF